LDHKARPLTIALAGNPNSGKTTIFNNLTGANQHVGNYPGVTVEKKEGTFNYRGRTIRVVDLPGTYSLSAYSIEEIIARNYVIEEKPDIVIDIVDASNIERNLYLTTQLMELGTPVIIALNMSDMARNRGIVTDEKHLSQLLGVPVVPTVGNKRRGMDQLMQAAFDLVENRQDYNPAAVNYGKEFEEEIARVVEAIESHAISLDGYRPRWIALKLIEDDTEIREFISGRENGPAVLEIAESSRKRIESLFGDSPSIVMSDRRYGFISGACSEAVALTAHHRHDVSDKIDLAMIHPVLGLPIFAFLMWLMFNLTFTLGEKPMEWIETGVSALAPT